MATMLNNCKCPTAYSFHRGGLNRGRFESCHYRKEVIKRLKKRVAKSSSRFVADGGLVGACF